MFSQSAIVLFLVTSVVLILAPGPDSIYVLTQGLSRGRKAGLISAIGVTLGILVHTAFAAFGLAVILMTSSIAFTAVKLTGAIYLIYLGIKALINKNSIPLNAPQKAMNTKKIFTQGILSNVLNPKVALFFMTFLPQFVSPNRGPASLQMLTYGGLFAGMTLLYLGLVGYFSGHMGTWLNQKAWLSTLMQRISGSILVALGIRLAFINYKH